jgi:beta-phosphoglucomutase-like phosphatase (HAD superfamily)
MGTESIVKLSPRDFDAVLFDLDGVLTKTANVHAAAWKRLFDQFLEKRAAELGDVFVAFDENTDYRRYVDGNDRRSDGRSASHSSGEELPDVEHAGSRNSDATDGG